MLLTVSAELEGADLSEFLLLAATAAAASSPAADATPVGTPGGMKVGVGGREFGQQILGALRAALGGELARARLLTLTSSFSSTAGAGVIGGGATGALSSSAAGSGGDDDKGGGIIDLQGVEQQLRTAMGERGSPTVTSALGLSLLAACRAADASGEGFVSGFAFGQTLLQVTDSLAHSHNTRWPHHCLHARAYLSPPPLPPPPSLVCKTR